MENNLAIEEIKTVLEGVEEYFSEENYKKFYNQALRLAEKLLNQDINNEEDNDDFYDADFDED